MADVEVLSGGGEMGALMRGLDWSKTPVGPVASWPQSLRTAISIILASKFPMYVAWGREFTQFYNDGYRPILGSTKHPAAMGLSTRKTFAEIWHIIGPMFDGVMKGEAVGVVDYLLPLDRHGFVEECYFSFSYSPIRDETGGVGGVLVTVTETTGRVLGERRLRVLRDIAARTAKATDEGDACRAATEVLERRDIPFGLIYLIDPDGKTARCTARGGGIAAASEAPERIAIDDRSAAWPLDEVASAHHPVVVTRSFGSVVDDIGEIAIQKAVALPIARPGDSKPAGVLIAGISPRLILDESYRGFLDLVSDQIATAIANARALQESRARAEALAELDRAKTTFFSNVSHEFRTPLTLLLGPLDDLVRKRIPGPDGELIAVAHRNALRLLKLVNTLLEFSRIEAGRIEASYEPVALESVTAELASVFRSAVERAGLRFQIETEPLGESAYVDRDMWEKIVFNLLSNALKFTFDGSITLRLQCEGGEAVLRVIDTGSGIPEAELSNVFTRFHRIGGVRARSQEGTGIGLALVQELTRLHGGTVGVESSEGEGSTFTVRIPLGRAHLPAERIQAQRSRVSAAIRADAFVQEALQWIPYAEEAPAATSAPKTGRILLADDNADMRDYVERLLAPHWEVEAVSDGFAALEAAERRRPDLVLSDVMMPGLDGFELLRELRARPELAGIPVLLLSARAGEEARVEGIGAGADDYLVKPFSARELLARVRTHYELARAREKAAGVEHELRQAAEETSERYRAILRSITDGFISFDDEWKVTFVNAEGAAIAGRLPEDLIGRDLGRLFPEAAGSRFHEACLEAKRHDRTVEVEAYFPPLQKWLQVIAYPSVEGLSVIVRDITARIEAEEQVRQRDQRQVEMLQLLTHASISINSALSLDQMLKTITEAARQIVGAHVGATYLTADDRTQAIRAVSVSDKYAQWRSSSVASLIGESIDSLVYGAKQPVRLTQEEWESHRPAQRSPVEGGLSMGGLLAVPLRSRNGRSVGVIQLSDRFEGEFNEQDEAILVQLAQLASVAVENAMLYEELQLANQAKDEFLATLSHELRTPMTATLGWASLLRLGDLTNETVRTALESIETSTKAQSRLIEDILDVSRISTGKLQLDIEDIDICRTVLSALETIRSTAADNGVEVQFETATSGWIVRGDSARLQQIFWNILANAVKFTPSGGRISIRGGVLDGRVFFTIADTGEGISPEFLPHVFDRFRQAAGGLKRRHGGLGLGLAIARNLAEAHGGTITAASDGLGRGATFTVEFPLLQAAAQERVGQERQLSVPLRDLAILLVEDQNDTRVMLTTALSRMGAQVVPAASVSEALESIAARRPDLIVSDVAMPGADGFDLVRQIRAGEDDRNPRIPMVALTALASSEDGSRLLAAGFDAHATKPIDPRNLAEIILTVSRSVARG